MISLLGSLLAFLQKWKSATQHSQACETTASPSASEEGGGVRHRGTQGWLLAFVALVGIVAVRGSNDQRTDGLGQRPHSIRLQFFKSYSVSIRTRSTFNLYFKIFISY